MDQVWLKGTPLLPSVSSICKGWSTQWRDIDDHINAVVAKCLLLGEECVWTTTDGSKLHLQPRSHHLLKQNANHNDWLSHTHANSVLVFTPDKFIRCAAVDCPGSWHDSTQADCGNRRNLEQVHAIHGARVVVDSAFGFQSKDFLIKRGQEDMILWGTTTRQDKDAGLCC